MGKLQKKMLFHCCDDLISLMDWAVARAEGFLKDTQCEKNTSLAITRSKRDSGSFIGANGGNSRSGSLAHS